MEKRLTTPFTKDKIKDLKAGDSVLITGTIYTARDAAHERMTTNFKNGIPFPIDLTDNVIYYAGPCPAKPGEVIGSCGPTTAGRMDAYTPMLLDNGLRLYDRQGRKKQRSCRRNEEIWCCLYWCCWWCRCFNKPVCQEMRSCGLCRFRF